jgi:hypothetical protein
MEFLVGLIAAVAVVGFGYTTRQARSLPFYCAVLVVIALLYVLFAVMAGAPRTILIESAVAAAFVAVAVAGARSPHTGGLLVAGGLAAHGVYDLLHPAVAANPVVPGWWPLVCGVVDVGLGGWVLVLSRQGMLKTAPSGEAPRTV